MLRLRPLALAYGASILAIIGAMDACSLDSSGARPGLGLSAVGVGAGPTTSTEAGPTANGGMGGAGGDLGTGGSGGLGSAGIGGAGACFEKAYALTEVSPVLIMDDTEGATNENNADGCDEDGQSSGELIYAVIPNVSGVVTASFTSDYMSLVYVRTDCDGENSEIMCRKEDFITTFAVIAGTTYYVVVDGVDGEEGIFSLSLTLAKS